MSGETWPLDGAHGLKLRGRKAGAQMSDSYEMVVGALGGERMREVCEREAELWPRWGCPSGGLGGGVQCPEREAAAPPEHCWF